MLKSKTVATNLLLNYIDNTNLHGYNEDRVNGFISKVDSYDLPEKLSLELKFEIKWLSLCSLAKGYINDNEEIKAIHNLFTLPKRSEKDQKTILELIK